MDCQTPVSTRDLRIPPRITRSQKSCANCKKGHLRCNASTIPCINCKKKKLHCEGYQPVPRRWIHKFTDVSKASSTQSAHKLTSDGGHRRYQPFRKRGQKPSGTTSLEQQSPSSCLTADPGIAIDTLWKDITLANGLLNGDSFLEDHYYKAVAAIMSIYDSNENPFRESIKYYACSSPALWHTVLATAAVHLSDASDDEKVLYRGWNHRTQAITLLRSELSQNPWGIATFAAVILLAMTESWFDHGKCGLIHLYAAQELLVSRPPSLPPIPTFLANALCWLETLASFVSDYTGLVFKEPQIYRTIQQDLPQKKRSLNFTMQDAVSQVPDPLLGIWSSIFPYIGCIGATVRQIRKLHGGKTRVSLSDLEKIESNLMEWDISKPVYQSDAMDTPLIDLAKMAKCYKLSAILTLYYCCPNLLSVRARVLPATETAAQFLDHLANSVIAFLREIPITSGLWHVSSFPILMAGSFANSSETRTFLCNIIMYLRVKNKISAVSNISDILKAVWRRQDKGENVFWLDILDEWKFEGLLN